MPIVWHCKDCNFDFGAPMINSDYNVDQMINRCPYCGSKNISLSKKY